MTCNVFCGTLNLTQPNCDSSDCGRMQFIICPMRQQHWTDYKISLCVCESVSQSVSEFRDPLHISATVEARNFKFGMQIDHYAGPKRNNAKLG